MIDHERPRPVAAIGVRTSEQKGRAAKPGRLMHALLIKFEIMFRPHACICVCHMCMKAWHPRLHERARERGRVQDCLG